VTAVTRTARRGVASPRAGARSARREPAIAAVQKAASIIGIINARIARA
jgi:hypothetical protein